MKEITIWYLTLSFLCVFLEGFFSMFEMASVSFNKMRLQYYVSKKNKRAIWLDYLLKKPSRLFATTLIAVNTVLLIGAESSRRFYETIGLSSNYAPITQIIVVVILGELSPLFAARRYPEHISLFNIPVVFFLSKLFLPVIYLIEKLSSFVNFLFKNKEETKIFLTKKEIETAFYKKDISFDPKNIVSNIFLLKNLKAKEMAIPLFHANIISSDGTFQNMKNILEKRDSSFVIVYHKNIYNIVGICLLKNLLKEDLSKKIINFTTSAWFVVENVSVLDILKQFKNNKQEVAIMLDSFGKAKGILTLDMIIDKLFGENFKHWNRKVFIEKTLSGKMLVSDFNKKFKSSLEFEKKETLSDLINKKLKHSPSVGEIIYFENFEFIITETTILGTKKVLVRNLNL